MSLSIDWNYITKGTYVNLKMFILNQTSVRNLGNNLTFIFSIEILPESHFLWWIEGQRSIELQKLLHFAFFGISIIFAE